MPGERGDESIVRSGVPQAGTRRRGEICYRVAKMDKLIRLERTTRGRGRESSGYNGGIRFDGNFVINVNDERASGHRRNSEIVHRRIRDQKFLGSSF